MHAVNGSQVSFHAAQSFPVEEMLVDASLALGRLPVRFLNLQPSAYLVSDWLDVLDSASEGKRLNLIKQI